jgi:hypothetical protein
MDPDTFKQIAVPCAILRPAYAFLQPGMELPVEFFEEEPTSGLSRRKRYQTPRLVGEAALAQPTAFEHRLRRYAASVVTNSLRQATSVVFPDVAEACVATTAPPLHSQHDSAWKKPRWTMVSPFTCPCSLLPAKSCALT